jgi:hypothetical protein
VRYLLTNCQSLPNFCHHQIMVSITICSPERLDIMHTWMPSPIYQNMVNLVVHLSIRRRPSEFMNVMVWEHCTFDDKIFGRGKVYYSFKSVTINYFRTPYYMALALYSLLNSCICHTFTTDCNKLKSWGVIQCHNFHTKFHKNESTGW